MVLLRIIVPVNGDAVGVRQEWLYGWWRTLLEAKWWGGGVEGSQRWDRLEDSWKGS